MSDILRRIEAYKREEIAAARRVRDDAQMRRDAEAACAMTDARVLPRGFASALRASVDAGRAAVKGA